MNALQFLELSREIHSQLDVLHKLGPRFDTDTILVTVSAFGPIEGEGALVLEGKPQHKCDKCGSAYSGGPRDVRLTFLEAADLARWILKTVELEPEPDA